MVDNYHSYMVAAVGSLGHTCTQGKITYRSDHKISNVCTAIAPV